MTPIHTLSWGSTASYYYVKDKELSATPVIANPLLCWWGVVALTRSHCMHTVQATSATQLYNNYTACYGVHKALCGQYFQITQLGRWQYDIWLADDNNTLVKPRYEESIQRGYEQAASCRSMCHPAPADTMAHLVCSNFSLMVGWMKVWAAEEKLKLPGFIIRF